MAEHMRLSLDMVSVDRSCADPMHRQIYSALRRLILEGRIESDTLLPSTRSLAEDLGVGRNTVIAAYDQLLAEGFIEARAGSGTWVAPIPQNRPKPAASPRRSNAERLSRRGRTIVGRGSRWAPNRTATLPARRSRASRDRMEVAHPPWTS